MSAPPQTSAAGPLLDRLGVEPVPMVAGVHVRPDGGVTFSTAEPATGEPLAMVTAAGPEEVDAAIRAARQAARGPWGQAPPGDRGAVLRRIAAGLRRDADALAELESRDAGKPIADAREDVEATAAAFETWAVRGEEVRGTVVASGAGRLEYAVRQPIGAVGVIVPWNYPLVNLAAVVPIALAVGNGVVVKPAEQTPLTALALGAIARDAGLPPGALSVLPGDGPGTGWTLASHPDLDMVHFVGSTTVGRQIAEAAGRNLTKATLELGGKSPNVVFADSDLEAVARAAVFSFTVNAGQYCAAGTRLIVEASVHDELVARIVARAEELRLGDPLDPRTQIGAIISPEQLARIERLVGEGVADGARPVTGGGRARVAGHLAGGTFFAPTVLTGVTPAMSVAQEEIFGPVLSVLRFEGEDEAVALANAVSYGLEAAVWTRDVTRAHRLAHAIEAGVVYVNTISAGSAAPHGTYKGSGMGLVGGREQAEEMTLLKSVVVSLGESPPAFD